MEESITSSEQVKMSQEVELSMYIDTVVTKSEDRDSGGRKTVSQG